MNDGKKCPVCGGEEFKQGKLHGQASVQPMKCVLNWGEMGGSELILTFCAQCGEVISLQVRNPEIL